VVGVVAKVALSCTNMACADFADFSTVGAGLYGPGPVCWQQGNDGSSYDPVVGAFLDFSGADDVPVAEGLAGGGLEPDLVLEWVDPLAERRDEFSPW
jgi:hypothetical protein